MPLLLQLSLDVQLLYHLEVGKVPQHLSGILVMEKCITLTSFIAVYNTLNMLLYVQVHELLVCCVL